VQKNPCQFQSHIQEKGIRKIKRIEIQDLKSITYLRRSYDFFCKQNQLVELSSSPLIPNTSLDGESISRQNQLEKTCQNS
jgi:hypothetical protein